MGHDDEAAATVLSVMEMRKMREEENVKGLVLHILVDVLVCVKMVLDNFG